MKCSPAFKSIGVADDHLNADDGTTGVWLTVYLEIMCCTFFMPIVGLNNLAVLFKNVGILPNEIQSYSFFQLSYEKREAHNFYL